MSRARSALRARWLELRPRHAQKTAKGARLWFFAVFVVFGRACGFLPSLWFLGELVVFCRLCGFWASLWFFGAFHFPSPTDPYSRAHLSSIDEDALEGVYFAFSLILRCLPYFCQKTRPRASYDLLRAHSGVLVAVGLQGAGVHRRAPSDIMPTCDRRGVGRDDHKDHKDHKDHEASSSHTRSRRFVGTTRGGSLDNACSSSAVFWQ